MRAGLVEIGISGDHYGGKFGKTEDKVCFSFPFSPKQLLGFIMHDGRRLAADLYERSTNSYT